MLLHRVPLATLMFTQPLAVPQTQPPEFEPEPLPDPEPPPVEEAQYFAGPQTLADPAVAQQPDWQFALDLQYAAQNAVPASVTQVVLDEQVLPPGREAAGTPGCLARCVHTCFAKSAGVVSHRCALHGHRELPVY